MLVLVATVTGALWLGLASKPEAFLAGCVASTVLNWAIRRWWRLRKEKIAAAKTKSRPKKNVVPTTAAGGRYGHVGDVVGGHHDGHDDGDGYDHDHDHDDDGYDDDHDDDDDDDGDDDD